MAFKELGRQSVHAGFGIAVVLFGLWAGKVDTLLALTLLLAIAVILICLKLRNVRIPIIDSFLEQMERPDVFPGKGALFHIIGVMVAVFFAPTLQFGLALVAILALGDGFSTFIGVNWGSHKLIWSPKKSLEGMLAFAITASIGAYFLIGNSAFAYSAILAAVETIPLDAIDDNLLIPIVGIAIKAAATYFGI